MNVQNNDWLVVRYKPNQLKRVEDNLNNQDLTFYTPKVNKKDFKKDQNKKVVLFPGYGFIKNGFNRIHSIRYTKGILSILKFGSKYALMHDKKIREFIKAEKLSDPRPLIYVCDLHNYIEELAKYLYENQLLKYIEVYVTKVNPTNTPKFIGVLIDSDCSEDLVN